VLQDVIPGNVGDVLPQDPHAWLLLGQVLLVGRQLLVEAHARVPFLQAVHLPTSLPFALMHSSFFLMLQSLL
jgi:hypothetical protein